MYTFCQFSIILLSLLFTFYQCYIYLLDLALEADLEAEADPVLETETPLLGISPDHEADQDLGIKIKKRSVIK